MPTSPRNRHRGAGRLPTAGRRPTAGRTRVLGLLLAWALTVAGALLPAIAPGLPVPAPLSPVIVRAAGDQLEVATAADYVLDPEARRVRVAVDLDAVNRKPNAASGGVITRYRYDGVSIGVPREAARIRATQNGQPVEVTTVKRDGFKLVTARFRRPLYFGDHARLHVTFDMPAGKARSGSGVRIGKAFASFPVWAYGDRASVRVEVPSRYTVATRGRELAPAGTSHGAMVLEASTADPLGWYSFVDATDDSALATREVTLPAGDRIELRGWPEDGRWRKVAGAVLSDGIPELQRRIGLPWPVAGTLTVTEVHTPLLEGYAGFYDPATARITIGEQLDRLTLVHEASHAWFNGTLFTDRWITEGLADEYAARALKAQGSDAPSPPKVSRKARGAFALGSWPAPAAIADRAAARREQYGYAASWTVMRRVVRAAGEAGMRRVFAAAAARTTAYPGDAPAETTALPNDWRRLVDLAEELGGARDVASYVAAWAVPADADPPLKARAAARTAYHSLVDRGAGWAAPAVVRTALDAWEFAAARGAISAAGAVLDARDALATRAEAQDLGVPEGLEAAYEGAASEAALALVRGRLLAADETLAVLADAQVAVDAPRDWLAGVGLGDEDPAAALDAARSAWSAGDTTGAGIAAGQLVARVRGASDAGRTRVLAIALLPALAAAGLVIGGLVIGGRRRRAVRG